MGNSYLLNKQTNEALLAFEKAIELDANNSDAYLGKGDALTYSKKFKDAIAAYDMAIKKRKFRRQMTEILDKKGEALICMKKFICR